jgi:hypothetical protein
MAGIEPKPRSGGVTAVAVLNFVFGGIALACGILGLIGGAFLGALSSGASNTPNITIDGKPAGGEASKEFEKAQKDLQEAAKKAGGTLGGLALLVTVLSVVSIAQGALEIIAGIGLIQRRNWGRILTLILGGLAVILAILNVVQFNIVGLIINVVYAILVFVFLLGPKAAAEFS